MVILTKSFQLRDYNSMNLMYTENSHFKDPVFELKGKEISAMWHMLCERGTDLKITFKNVEADHKTGSVDWIAEYTFSATGRKVRNVVHAEFEFEHGKVIRHTDHFSFYRWSVQAFGIPGILLGWTPFLQKKVQRQAAVSLRSFINKN